MSCPATGPCLWVCRGLDEQRQVPPGWLAKLGQAEHGGEPHLQVFGAGDRHRGELPLDVACLPALPVGGDRGRHRDDDVVADSRFGLGRKPSPQRIQRALDAEAANSGEVNRGPPDGRGAVFEESEQRRCRCVDGGTPRRVNVLRWDPHRLMGQACDERDDLDPDRARGLCGQLDQERQALAAPVAA